MLFVSKTNNFRQWTQKLLRVLNIKGLTLRYDNGHRKFFYRPESRRRIVFIKRRASSFRIQDWKDKFFSSSSTRIHLENFKKTHWQRMLKTKKTARLTSMTRRRRHRCRSGRGPKIILWRRRRVRHLVVVARARLLGSHGQKTRRNSRRTNEKKLV